MDREEVIKGLEHEIIRANIPTCGTDFIDCVEVALLRDALALLKAQKPRVMTLGEIGKALKMPLWKETKSANKYLYTGWVLAYDIQKGEGITGTRLGMSEPSGRVTWYRLDDYGKTWRCWTSRPTDEQREAIPWIS